jgi:hypothetical protein
MERPVVRPRRPLCEAMKALRLHLNNWEGRESGLTAEANSAEIEFAEAYAELPMPCIFED